MEPWDINVVNKRRHKGEGIYVGRPSPLGNPFEIGKDGGRDDVIRKYREWLRDKMSTNNRSSRMFVDLFNQVNETGELTLICWCSPKKCHADVIREFLIEAWTEIVSNKSK